MASTAHSARHELELDMQAQPDDTTCGPTCLHAVYQYLGDPATLPDVIKSVPKLENGGTLGVLLGIDALRKGYQVTIFTYNLQVFDPTWFGPGAPDLAARLALQAQHKRSTKLKQACAAYIEFLRLGGKIRWEELNGRLLRKYLDRNLPVLTGLSSTYLYNAMREFGPDDDDDDIRGTPSGHFVVLSGYDRVAKLVDVVDPLQSNPHSPTRRYQVRINRVLTSILLGVLTYDANLIIIDKP